MGSSFGKIFRITSFGESHGPAIGIVIDGCPAGTEIDFNFISRQLARRKPGQSSITTQRNETEEFEILSGILDGKTLGSPVCVIIKNKDQRSEDYEKLKDVYRPSHADFTYEKKYGIRDHRGGGRSSARATAGWVIAGSIAQSILVKNNIAFHAYVSQVGNISLEKNYNDLDLSKIDSNIVRCPDERVAQQMIDLIEKVKTEGDSVGGVITCIIKGIPPGLGEPLFDKLGADLAKAMLNINAVKGFEIGSGFEGTKMKGSEHNDEFERDKTKNLQNIKTKTNFSGGIQGGISNGEDIYFRVAFKPVATIQKEQSSVNTKGEEIKISGKGRHDPCVLPRAVPIVESMAALVIMDHWLRNKISK